MKPRVLLYRPGSIGDTVVALPCLNFVHRVLSPIRLGVLTDKFSDGNALAIDTVLAGTGLVDDALAYPPHLGCLDLFKAAKLRSQIRRWAPDALLYLPLPPTKAKVARDLAFFKACGIRRIIGAPVNSDLARHRFDVARGLYETEAERLCRCVASVSQIDLGDRANWDLKFSASEAASRDSILSAWSGRGAYVAFGVGTKLASKDWGDANWSQTLATISRISPSLGIVAVGVASEWERSEKLLTVWRGPRLNLCGATSLRLSALLIQAAQLYLGHDSGPMHLAAAVGTTCICVFTRQSPPGVWFPYGPAHHALHPDAPRESQFRQISPAEITPAEVIERFAQVSGSGQSLCLTGT